MHLGHSGLRCSQESYMLAPCFGMAALFIIAMEKEFHAVYILGGLKICSTLLASAAYSEEMNGYNTRMFWMFQAQSLQHSKNNRIKSRSHVFRPGLPFFSSYSWTLFLLGISLQSICSFQYTIWRHTICPFHLCRVYIREVVDGLCPITSTWLPS